MSPRSFLRCFFSSINNDIDEKDDDEDDYEAYEVDVKRDAGNVMTFAMV